MIRARYQTRVVKDQIVHIDPKRYKLSNLNKSEDAFTYPDHGIRIVSHYLDSGKVLLNCGMDDCPDNHFPVRISTGRKKRRYPKICVGGKYIFQRDVNDAGRGMNLVVVDSHRLEAVLAKRFDTSELDSSELELFLLTEVREGDIVIAVTHEEASLNLGQIAQAMLCDLGSNQIQNLRYRGQWYMITQKGINGFTPYEKLKHAVGGVGRNIDVSLCVPRKNPQWLAEVLSQPGIHPAHVHVIHNPALIKGVPELCHLFGFGNLPTTEVQYHKLMELAFDYGLLFQNKSEYITILEEGLLLAPDFLIYTSTMLPLLDDSSVMAISAWNPNGYTTTSSRPDLVYRIEGYPGLAFTMRKDVFMQEFKPNMKDCCTKRGWEGWTGKGRRTKEIVIPDVSRVFRKPVGPELEPETPIIKAYFKRLRATSLNMNDKIKQSHHLQGDLYEDVLHDLITSPDTTVLNLSADVIRKCAIKRDTAVLGITLGGNRLSNHRIASVLAYRERNMQEFLGMKLLCRCFGLFYEAKSPPQGMHRGLIRFTVNGERVVLLSNLSPHFYIPPYNETKLTLP
ncbi:protein O-linked-mannose beta-1,2-N-acetylglucosaminyltransferase 1-like [Oratosquilla oratoria]|uniref:protein O-linked-mannose beta-1,2-N-acetylglucosaminyltransferase 1-like n=1 Tax=Oratosquilla oratoria TaxID=337810 RepID=UPI003F765BA1